MNLTYKRPNIYKNIKNYEKLLNIFRNSNSLDEQLAIIKKINKIRDDFFSMYWLSYINYLLDVSNKYWHEEETFFSKWHPIMENWKLKYYDALQKSKFKNELELKIGKKVFLIAELELKMLNENIIEDLSKDEVLKNKYSKLKTTIKVKFSNEEYSLSKFENFLLFNNRSERINAYNVLSKEMKKHEKNFDDLLDEFITIRNKIANKLGYDSYSDVSYIQMRRIGYDRKDIEAFRENIKKYIVPIVIELKKKQEKELEIDKLMYYDNSIFFKDNVPKPKGDTIWIIEQAIKMYDSISPKLSKLFRKMWNNGLMDLDARDNKSGGGIATYIPKYEVPIFVSNFNGSASNITTLVHEFGHSFQLYSSKNLKYYENWWPTFDCCEIHSKSMEFLTLKYSNMFFLEDSKKFEYEFLVKNLESLCYMAIVDEFQHIIYDNKDFSVGDRKQTWLSLEKMYTPWINYGEDKYYNDGNSFQSKSHIFINPFYYIDYALATFVAFQFYALSLKNEKETWEKYINFCELGGTYSFNESIERIDMLSPFSESSFKEIVDTIYEKIK